MITEDSSTPAPVETSTGSGSLSATTASFSPPGGSLLVALVEIGYGTTAPSVTVSDSGSHTWTPGPAVNGTFAWAGIFTAPLTSAPGSITVTATDSVNHNGSGMQLALRVVDGAASSQSGAASATQTGTSAAPQSSITTTSSGSWVYVSAQVNKLEGTVTPTASTTTIVNFQDSGGGATQLAGRQSGSTATPGATTLGWTVGTSDHWAWAALEILPAPPPPAALLIPPGRLSPLAWQWRALPTGAPLLVSDADTGSASESSSTALSSADTGTGAESSSTAFSDTDTGSGSEASSTALSSSDTGTGTDSGSATVQVSITAMTLIPPGRQNPAAFRFQAWPSQASAAVTVASSDTGSAAESSSTAFSSADTGTGAESSSTALSDSDSAAGAESSSTAFSSGDTGSGAESGSVLAAGGPPAAPLIPPGRQNPAAFPFRAPSPAAPAAHAVADSDSATAAEGAFAVPSPPAQQGSWWGLVSVLRQSRSEFNYFVSRPPSACPHCGEPLSYAPATAAGSGVERYCKYDGFQYPRDWTPPSRPMP